MTGLVLEGGGMRGLYTAGVIDIMLDHGFEPDVVCGTSAGVTFGVNLLSKQEVECCATTNALLVTAGI